MDTLSKEVLELPVGTYFDNRDGEIMAIGKCVSAMAEGGVLVRDNEAEQSVQDVFGHMATPEQRAKESSECWPDYSDYYHRPDGSVIEVNTVCGFIRVATAAKIAQEIIDCIESDDELKEVEG